MDVAWCGSQHETTYGGTDLVVLAHGHARGVLSLALLSRHPLARVIRRWQRPGAVRGGILALLRRELTVRPVLLTHVPRLEDGMIEKRGDSRSMHKKKLKPRCWRAAKKKTVNAG